VVKKKMPEGTRWDPGATPYPDYLRSLSPAQRSEHLRVRREKKSMKAAMAAVTAEYQARWISELHNAAWKQLIRARDTGDTAAFVAVWDRIVGRPQDLSSVESARPLPWSDADI